MEADSIRLSFGNRCILSDIYVRCDTGKVTGLLGRNGQGKTCLMNMIYGSLKGENQSIRFDRTYIPYPVKRPDLLLYLPQFHFIPGRLKVARVFADYQLSFAAFTACFPEFRNRQNERTGNLSGGERRMIEVYLILKSAAQFIMLDEPFSHIMPLHLATLRQIITEEKQHKGILISDHMYREILDTADTIYVLKDGKTHLTKSHDDILKLGYANTL